MRNKQKKEASENLEERLEGCQYGQGAREGLGFGF